MNKIVPSRPSSIKRSAVNTNFKSQNGSKTRKPSATSIKTQKTNKSKLRDQENKKPNFESKSPLIEKQLNFSNITYKSLLSAYPKQTEEHAFQTNNDAFMKTQKMY